MDTIYYIVLISMVYAAFIIFFAGTLLKLNLMLKAPKQLITVQIYPEKRPNWLFAIYDTFFLPTIFRQDLILWAFLMLFHAAFFLLIIGHLELIKSISIFQIVPHEIFIGKGYVGLTISLALLYFLFRRFVSPIRELSVPEDYYLLILLFLIVLFGSELDWARRWFSYGELPVEAYRNYLLSLIKFKPVLPYEVRSSGHSFMLVLHVFFANLFLMFFPFSKIVHSFLSLPMNKLRRG